MTVDAVGGVWRYALDLAAGLKGRGLETVFAIFGPAPSAQQRRDAEAVGSVFWCDAPLDWMVETQSELKRVPEIIDHLARQVGADFVHINLPSQAAGLRLDIPIVVVSHSCVTTWFHAVRGTDVPPSWQWQEELNRSGFARAETVLSPSRSHAALLGEVYGRIDRLDVVWNGSRVCTPIDAKEDMVFAAGRWWDEGKNGAVLDAAAAEMIWPLMMAGARRGPSGQHLALNHARARAELSHTDTIAGMAKAAVFVSPSLYEPFGLSVLEAARCGCALVLADIPTYRELWDGAALFADPRDPQAIAQAVNRLAMDEALRWQLAERALARSKRFTIEAQSDAMLAIYGRLLSSSRVLSVAESS
ncbi:glycosyltransferase [Agrobacterium vitis]|uniref:glycosyltransferase family 4 protein n=1 Tax=Agrobacterium vitis TaxID=373 RepID=UPI0012E82894|nr:glycosyltransferase family 4 protein [Agrobacterium vitis]MVA38039.1 glycosyltransferase [Agrobacterium vitis]MVA82512.1 glycosyltransferase [Agrobacterium vitis]